MTSATLTSLAPRGVFRLRLSGAAGAGLVALALLALVFNRQVCLFEASISARLLQGSGLVDRAHQVGAGVLFSRAGEWGGFLLTPGCSIAMLLSPFLVIAGLLLIIGRGAHRSIAQALVAVVAIFAVTNQLRLLLMAEAMDLWGFTRGYELSHVFAGSAISAIGFMLGLIVFVVVLTRDRRGEF